jgi:ATP-dependent protease HslVU (ClpYQ) peptidase subunit
MTCIIGLVHEDTIYMGGDSALTDTDNMTQRVMADQKVFVKDSMIIGCCSSLRVMQLLEHSLQLPDQGSRQSDIEYLVLDFMDAVRTVLKDKGSLKKENELETHDAQFLIGYNGVIYTVEEDYQMYQCTESWAAVGSGSDLALGAMYALRNVSMTPEEKIRVALEAAASYNATVRAPFYVLKLEPEPEEE